ncbi:hypothetical protein RE474_06320 [Methanolobus sediminis]|uniref:DUF4145 domain-containing protein n=1 Tax=Methanolobus sediminis TaxID=3072978 RepID=A0AA51YN66_9EURY|nr:hypothetical protein [Methanolobus sediminis]WMW26323.1 hypothetical protein RE474_06320 [Methanolobus sediminis]
MSDELICTKLAEIIRHGYSMIHKLGTGGSYWDNEYQRDIVCFNSAAKNILLIRFGEDSHFYTDYDQIKVKIGEFESEYSYYRRYVRRKIGLLEAVLDALKSGLTDDQFYQRELLVFSDMLTQAFEFHDKGLLLAAGIYGRVVLETTIKEFAKKNNVEFTQKFDQIIIALRQENLINHPFEISLRANYKIGSLAAHGNEEFNDLNDKEILEFLSFIRDKVLTLN